MNIRKVGDYEITLFDADDRRIKEYVSNHSLYITRQQALELMKQYKADSYTISRILDNSKYSVWNRD